MNLQTAQRTRGEVLLRARQALEELALIGGASGYIWMVVGGDGGNLGGCSPNLKPYEAALMDEVEKATARPVVVTTEGTPSRLPQTEKVLLALAKTRHVELHPIVATMIQGLNEIKNHKVPRIKALADPSTIPAWFPLGPEAYASRSQKMDLHQLFAVLDSIFQEIRGNLRSIRALHSMLDKAYKTGSCSIGTRAGMDSYFHFLEEEALSSRGEQDRSDVLASEHGACVPSLESFLQSLGNGQGFSAFGEYQGAQEKAMECCGLLPLKEEGFGLLPDATMLPSVFQLPQRYTVKKSPPLERVAVLQNSSSVEKKEDTGSDRVESFSSEEGGTGAEKAETAAQVDEAVKAFAQQKAGKGYLWMVVTENEGKVGGCSPHVRVYAPVLMDELERASQDPVLSSFGGSTALPKAADVMLPSVSHSELQQITAALVAGMDEISKRKGARDSSSRVPTWYPLAAEKFLGGPLSLDSEELLLVVDAILDQVRGQPSDLVKLHELVDCALSQSSGCTVQTRAKIEALFEHMERDAGLKRATNHELLSRKSMLTSTGVGEVLTAGGAVADFQRLPSIKSETGQEDPMENRVQQSGEATGSGRVQFEEELSVHSPALTGGLVEKSTTDLPQATENGSANPGNRQNGGAEAVAKPSHSAGQHAKGSEGKGRKRLHGLMEADSVQANISGVVSKKRTPSRSRAAAVYRPLPEKTPQAYDKMLSLLEALERSSG